MAVALGKLGRGKRKTGLTTEEHERRRNLALRNLKKIHRNQ
jgi:hypothetical protein